MKIFKSAFVLILFHMFFSLVQTSAQTPVANQPINAASRYILGDSDEILIKVNILGYVRKPGQYFIPRHTDLVTLISNAGGFVPGADLDKIQLLRQNAEEATNGSSGQKEEHEIKFISIEKYFETGKTSYLPTLRAGDSIVIKQSRGDKIRNFFGVNSVFNVVATLASVALIVDRLRYN
ncbi:MAG: SLBB domain-containing protein [Deferribacteres bacterium]|nr:SLBB domain-containing protein [candidate division KSB1 bacterium]MCB9501735.1 SLBB domain-containing protein [Deferribacteres bacterium]